MFLILELVSILFAIAPDYGNECMTKENKNWKFQFKKFCTKIKFQPQHLGSESELFYQLRWMMDFVMPSSYKSLKQTNMLEHFRPL